MLLLKAGYLDSRLWRIKLAVPREGCLEGRYSSSVGYEKPRTSQYWRLNSFCSVASFCGSRAQEHLSTSAHLCSLLSISIRATHSSHGRAAHTKSPSPGDEEEERTALLEVHRARTRGANCATGLIRPSAVSRYLAISLGSGQLVCLPVYPFGAFSTPHHITYAMRFSDQPSSCSCMALARRVIGRMCPTVLSSH